MFFLGHSSLAIPPDDSTGRSKNTIFCGELCAATQDSTVHHCSAEDGGRIDGVGSGKTFVGGELIRQAVEERRQRALLIAPAALRDGTWERFKDHYQLYIETISYEELTNDSQLGGAFPHLKNRSNEYALVIVDEAQAFRNPDTDRAKALRKLLQGRPPKQLVLLSATPVNNSLWDLYYLLTNFIKHDAEFADQGIRSLKEKFNDAMKQDPDDLKPDALFDVLDATTVRRTRHFVRRYYPNDRVKDHRGQEQPVRFPDPHVEADTYSFDALLPGFFEEIEEALAPENGQPKLTLARYSSTRKLPGAPPSVSEEALVGICRNCGTHGAVKQCFSRRVGQGLHPHGGSNRRMGASG